MPTTLAEPERDRETPRLPGELMLRSLPAQYQEILVAVYFRGQAVPEVARRLGLPPAAVKARLYRAMREMSDMVATEWVDRAPCR